jgi:hypothetical protein
MPFQMYRPTLISGAPTQIAIGMNVILATTWSKPRETNANVGHQMPITFDARSRPCRLKKHARHTSQLHPMPRKKIMWNSGVTCFLVANEITADLNGSAENTLPSRLFDSIVSHVDMKRDSWADWILTSEDDGHDE